ncbi:MAG: MarR family transcriptional regulator [Litoreibacter sp.]|nr:MarR family transcriptional regulator [Litoreibacter sp.]
MSSENDPLAVALFSEMFTADQLARNLLSKTLPKGMELSHFSVLNYLARATEPRTPAQLARTFNLSKGAITNTLHKLEWAGHIHINPDWEDARRKQVVISPAGRRARDAALEVIAPIIAELVENVGTEKVRAVLPVLRDLRVKLGELG